LKLDYITMFTISKNHKKIILLFLVVIVSFWALIFISKNGAVPQGQYEGVPVLVEEVSELMIDDLSEELDSENNSTATSSESESNLSGFFEKLEKIYNISMGGPSEWGVHYMVSNDAYAILKNIYEGTYHFQHYYSERARTLYITTGGFLYTLSLDDQIIAAIEIGGELSSITIADISPTGKRLIIENSYHFSSSIKNTVELVDDRDAPLEHLRVQELSGSRNLELLGFLDEDHVIGTIGSFDHGYESDTELRLKDLEIILYDFTDRNYQVLEKFELVWDHVEIKEVNRLNDGSFSVLLEITIHESIEPEYRRAVIEKTIIVNGVEVS
jgi:hypothetical protein